MARKIPKHSRVFGAEFTALKLVTKTIMGLRYKLRMMGIRLDGPANVFCDNKSVREAVAAGTSI